MWYSLLGTWSEEFVWHRGGRVGCVVGGAGSQILGLPLSSCVPGAGHFTALSSVMKGGEEQSSPQGIVDRKNL